MRLSRVLVAILAVLALNCFVATAAWGGEWEIKEEPLSSLEISGESLTSSGGAFELTVPTLSLTIKCTSESGSGEIIKGGSTSKVSLELSSCVVSKFEKVCSVKSTGMGSGVLATTATTKFLLKEVSETVKSYDEVVPAMTVEISGGECPFSSKLEMSGATAAEVPEPEEEATERVQKFSKTSVEQSGVSGLKLGKNQAFLIGEDKETLSGAHKKEALGVTEVILNPPWLFLAKLGERQSIWLENTSPLLVEYTNVAVTGPFALADPCKGKSFSETEICAVSLTCQQEPSGGYLLVEWNLLDLSEETIADGERKAVLGCALA